MGSIAVRLRSYLDGHLGQILLELLQHVVHAALVRLRRLHADYVLAVDLNSLKWILRHMV